jgi:hypothetical protein
MWSILSSLLTQKTLLFCGFQACASLRPVRQTIFYWNFGVNLQFESSLADSAPEYRIHVRNLVKWEDKFIYSRQE